MSEAQLDPPPREAGPGVIRRFAVLAVLDLAAKALGFTATVLLARHYGAEGFGAIGFAASVMAYGLMASACGLDVYAIKNAAAFAERLPRIASTVVTLRLGLAAAVYGVLLLLAATVPPLRAVSPLVEIFGLSVFTGAVSVAWVSQATRRTWALGLALLTTQAVYLVLVVFATGRGIGIWSAPAALVAGETVAAIGLFAWMIRFVGRPRSPLPLRESLAFLRQASPIGGSQLLRAAAMGSDLVVLGLFLSLEEVGWYGGAYRIFLLGTGFVAVYFIVLFPQLAREAARSRNHVATELRKSLIRTLPVAIMGIGAGMLLAPWALRVVFEPSFQTGTPALRLLLIALAVFLVNGHLRNTLLAMGRQHTDLGNVAGSAVVHVAAKLALVPALGITGAAVGTLAGETALLILSAWATRRALAGEPG